MADLNREREHWERLAASDPMWVILTEPGRERQWDPAEFFESGRREIQDVFARLDTLGIQPRRAVAVDFGCGLGRLTQALAERFDQVHGIDISDTMVSQAVARNSHGSRVAYHVNSVDSLPMITTGGANFVYSRITLQHVPRAGAEKYIAEFGRILAPGGVSVFQMPVRARNWTVRARHAVRNAFPGPYRWLRDCVSRRPRGELNTIPESSVVRILEGSALSVRAIIADDSAGPLYESRTFVATKPGN
jgi:trans-aconitate methyltransferase